MKDTTVAARYARGLFLVTEKRGETARALEDLMALGPVVEPGSRVGRMLAMPQLRLADKRAALLAALEKKANRTVVVFLDLLLRKKRLGEIVTVIAEFEALVEKAQGIRRAEVTSAVPLTAEERKRLHRELERTTGAKIKLTASVEPALLGGAQVRIGDRLIDRSVATLLDHIAKQLDEVSV
jgi:F-type H+-transporting ATPase subunit delta